MPPKDSVKIQGKWTKVDDIDIDTLDHDALMHLPTETLSRLNARRGARSRSSTPGVSPSSWEIVQPRGRGPTATAFGVANGRNSISEPLPGERSYTPVPGTLFNPAAGLMFHPGQLAGTPPLTKPLRKPPNTRCGCCKDIMKILPKRYLCGLCSPSVLILAMLLGSGMGPLVARSLLSTGAILESMGTGAGGFIQAGANMTHTASEIAIEISRGSLSLVQEAWHGIDIANAVVSSTSTRLFLHKNIDPGDFLASDLGHLLVKVPTRERNALLVVLSHIGPGIPYVSDSMVHFNVSGSYHLMHYQVKALAGGYVGLQFHYGNITFTPQWANPLWEAIGADVTREVGALQKALNSALEATAPWDLHRDELTTDLMMISPVVQTAWWHTLGWRVCRLLRRYRAWWLSPRSVDGPE